MLNIVLDTNCLIMAISARNRYHNIWQSFLQGNYILCVTNEIIEEYREVIARNISIQVADAVVFTILNRDNVLRVDPHYKFHLIEADEDDNKFVDCAIVSNAQYIVTQDRHFDILKNIAFPKVNIISIDEFVQVVENL